MYVVFLGAPGAGKGTQAYVVAQRLGLVHIAAGDLLRDAVRNRTELGAKAKGFMDRGELVPDDLVVAMIMDRLKKPDAAQGAVFDGFPRNVSQAEALDQALKERGAGVDVAVYLKVAEAPLIERLAGRWLCRSCGATYHEVANRPSAAKECDRCGGELYQREDDNPETVRRRLQVYLEQTEPVLAYYKDRGLLVEVDGEGPIPEITERIMDAILAAGRKSG